MSKEDTADLIKFLSPFSNEIQELALWLRGFVWGLYPEANELIYDNYNALALGWSTSDRLGETFCSVAVYGDAYVHFGFYWGSELTDPEKILLGKGNQYRYIKVAKKSDFPKVYIKKLLKEAQAYSLAKMKPAVTLRDKKKNLKGATIVKSSLPVKRRPGLITKKKNNR